MYVSFATWDITHKPQPKDNWMLKKLFSHQFSSFFLEALLETVRHEKNHTPNPMPKICCSKMSPDHPEAPHPPLPLVFRILPMIKIPSQHQHHQVPKEYFCEGKLLTSVEYRIACIALISPPSSFSISGSASTACCSRTSISLNLLK